MIPFYLLGAVIVVLALIGFVTCLIHRFWMTLAVTAAMLGYSAYSLPHDPDTLPYWGAVGAVLLVCLSFAIKARSAAPAARRSMRSTAGIIVDGTNVIYWNDQTPQLDTLRAVVDELKHRNLAPTVFLDASTRHHLKDKSLNENGFARALGLSNRQVMVCPAGTEADIFILKYARETGMPIVSNDRFGDRANQLKGLKVIKGVITNNRPIFDGF